MNFRPVILASFLLLSAASAAADQAGWELIGERTVDRNTGREEIDAQPTVYASHLRLCADRQAVRFEDLDVLYRNGNEQRVSVRALIPAGSCTRDIALSNQGERDIDRVALTYQAASGERTPRVFVFARAYRVLR